MIIKAIKQNLLEGLSHVMRAISGKNANPIFSCIHLIAKDNKLTMITTDNEIRIETKIPVAIEAEGETVIFAKKFLWSCQTPTWCAYYHVQCEQRW